MVITTNTQKAINVLSQKEGNFPAYPFCRRLMITSSYCINFEGFCVCHVFPLVVRMFMLIFVGRLFILRVSLES